MARVTRLVVFSQIVFLVGIGLCVLILPHFVFERNEGGMSNYGVHTSTTPFYTLAFALSAGLLLQARQGLPRTTAYRWLRLLFLVIVCSLLLELLSTYPYQHGAFYDDLHFAINIGSGIVELAAGAWIGLFFRRNPLNSFVFALLLISVLLMALVYAGALHILFITQILAVISLGVLLIRSTVPAPHP